MSLPRRIYLSPPHMGGKEASYLEEALSSNWVAPLGPHVDAFEDRLSGYCSRKEAHVLNSGTSAIHLALVLLGVEKGDEVLVSSFTFSGSVYPIVYQGAVPVLIDSEKQTWNMNPALLEEAIKERESKGKKPKAMVLVYLYGMPARLDEILGIAQKYGIPVIGDAAEALGSRYRDEPLASYGYLSILSFNGNKIITTSGGGALLSDDPDLMKRARHLSAQARDPAPHYQHSKIGYNYRMSNVLAGIGLGQMDVLEDRVKQKREVFKEYQRELKHEGIRFLEEPGPEFYSNYWLTCIHMDPGIFPGGPERLRIDLEESNIESRPLWKPMHLQPVFRECPAFVDGTSEELFRNGLCLPSGTYMSSQERTYVIGRIREWMKREAQ